MQETEDFFTWQTLEGEPIAVGKRTVTPQAQVLHVRWPGGGFVWNRPTGVRVDDGDQVEFFAITDVTRWALLGLWAVTAVTLFAASMVGIRRLCLNKE